MQSEQILDVMDIESIGCVCSGCGTEIILRLSTAHYHGSQCPNCGASWGPLPEVLISMGAVLQKIAAANLTLRFRVSETPGRQSE